MLADVLVAPWAEPAPAYSGRLLAASDLAALPDDGWLYELVSGRLVRMPPPKGRHGYLEAEMCSALRAYATPRGLGRVYVGETGFDLTRQGEPAATVLGADVAFLRAERVPEEDDGGEEDYFSGAPDLVVEIAPPRNSVQSWAPRHGYGSSARHAWCGWSGPGAGRSMCGCPARMRR